MKFSCKIKKNLFRQYFLTYEQHKTAFITKKILFQKLLKITKFSDYHFLKGV